MGAAVGAVGAVVGAAAAVCCLYEWCIHRELSTENYLLTTGQERITQLNVKKR